MAKTILNFHFDFWNPSHRLHDFQIVDLEKAVKDRVCSDFGNVSSFTTTVKLLFDMVFSLV